MIKRATSILLILIFLFAGFLASTIPQKGLNDKGKLSENKTDSTATEIIEEKVSDMQSFDEKKDEKTKSLKPNLSVNVMLYLIYRITKKSMQ